MLQIIFSLLWIHDFVMKTYGAINIFRAGENIKHLFSRYEKSYQNFTQVGLNENTEE